MKKDREARMKFLLIEVVLRPSSKPVGLGTKHLGVGEEHSFHQARFLAPFTIPSAEEEA